MRKRAHVIRLNKEEIFKTSTAQSATQPLKHALYGLWLILVNRDKQRCMSLGSFLYASCAIFKIKKNVTQAKAGAVAARTLSSLGEEVITNNPQLFVFMRVPPSNVPQGKPPTWI